MILQLINRISRVLIVIIAYKWLISSIKLNFHMFSNNYHYILFKLYISITTLMSLMMIYFFIVYFTYALCKWSTIFKCYLLFLLSGSALSAAVFSTVAVSLASMYTSLWSRKLDLIVGVLNLIWLPVLYVLYDPSFISRQVF